MVSNNDLEDMPLAKRQKILHMQRGLPVDHPNNPPLSTDKTSPDTSDVVIISDDSAEESIPPATRTASRSQPKKQLEATKPPAPAEEPDSPVSETKTDIISDSEVEEIEIYSTSDDDIEIVIDDDEEEEEEQPKSGHNAAETLSNADQNPKPSLKRPFGAPPMSYSPMSPPAARTNGNGGAGQAFMRLASGLGHNRRPQPGAPTMARPYQPHRAAAVPLDTPYEFTDREAAYQFRRAFNTRNRAPPGLGKTFVEKRAREILSDMTKPARQAVEKSKVAWNSAAMKWREKNKPSSDDIERRKKEETARHKEASRWKHLNTPSYYANVTGGGVHANPLGNGALPQAGAAAENAREYEPVLPAEGAPESEWRAYYRHAAQKKAAGAASFVQVLRTFDVPCEELSRIKDSYRLAVRMYHPDSNSREKVWNTPREKIEAEEIMKIINEKREKDL